MRDGFPPSRLSAAQRMALIQSTWTTGERRRRRELAHFLQRRLAWQIALDTPPRHGLPAACQRH